MTKLEIKNEIQKVLENMPENILQDILDLLKGLQNQAIDKLEITHALRQIIDEGHVIEVKYILPERPTFQGSFLLPKSSKVTISQ